MRRKGSQGWEIKTVPEGRLPISVPVAMTLSTTKALFFFCVATRGHLSPLARLLSDMGIGWFDLMEVAKSNLAGNV